MYNCNICDEYICVGLDIFVSSVYACNSYMCLMGIRVFCRIYQYCVSECVLRKHFNPHQQNHDHAAVHKELYGRKWRLRRWYTKWCTFCRVRCIARQNLVCNLMCSLVSPLMCNLMCIAHCALSNSLQCHLEIWRVTSQLALLLEAAAASELWVSC